MPQDCRFEAAAYERNHAPRQRRDGSPPRGFPARANGPSPATPAAQTADANTRTTTAMPVTFGADMRTDGLPSGTPHDAVPPGTPHDTSTATGQVTTPSTDPSFTRVEIPTPSRGEAQTQTTMHAHQIRTRRTSRQRASSALPRVREGTHRSGSQTRRREPSSADSSRSVSQRTDREATVSYTHLTLPTNREV